MAKTSFSPLDREELAGWLVQQRTSYIAERVEAGDTVAEATSNADASLERLFPSGSPAPGQMVGRVISDNVAVGTLWIGPFGSDRERWWVWDIEIDESHRGKGNGRAAMILAEALARSHGAQSIGLNVFAHNQIARRLYASLGYTETSVQMRKALGPTT